jgi:hypothetical protein
MAFLSVRVILGINIPFVLLLTSNIALALATEPSVLIAKDCALAELYISNNEKISRQVVFIFTFFNVQI